MTAAKHTFPCSGCGASLTFEPGTTSLTCDYCGNSQSIGANASSTTITEHDFSAGIAKASRQKAADLVPGGKEVRCDGCGARTVFEEEAGECPYCDTPVVVAQETGEDVLVPESLLPFKVTKREATDGFQGWVSSRWFAPSDLAKKAISEAINGVYMPYWSYDSQTTTDYTGERGEHYMEAEVYTDGEGNQQTREVQRTRWYPASGRVRVAFDDVLVYATKSLPRNLVQSLEPWDLADLQPYDPAFLSGMGCERYSIEIEAAFTLAEGRMQPRIRSACEIDIGGDEQRVHSMAIEHDNVTFKQLLLPIWISAFRYDGEVYRYLVNARTGEVSGERPYSMIKIVLFVLFIVGLIAGLIALASMKG